MRKQYYEFSLDTVEPIGAGRVRVTGRCGDFPIRVDDCLDCIFRYRPRKHPEEAGDDPILDARKPAALRVVEIHAYQRSLPELGQGMTGLMILEGAGAESLAPGWIVGRKDLNAAITPDAMRYTISDGNMVLILDRSPWGDFSVSSPLEPGIGFQAKTIEEAFSKAYDASRDLLIARTEESRRLIAASRRAALLAAEQPGPMPEAAPL